MKFPLANALLEAWDNERRAFERGNELLEEARAARRQARDVVAAAKNFVVAWDREELEEMQLAELRTALAPEMGSTPALPVLSSTMCVDANECQRRSIIEACAKVADADHVYDTAQRIRNLGKV